MRVVEFTLHHPTLRAAVRAVPETDVEWIRHTAFDDRSRMAFWAENGEEAFERALDGDPTVSVSRSFDVGARRLYQVELTGRGAGADIHPVLVEVGAVILTARITADGWHCHVCFPDESGIDRFFDACRDRDIPFDVHSLNGRHPSETPGPGLTDAQDEMIVTAYERGYFDVPRQCTLREVADVIGISDAAASQRLRRGIKRLVTWARDRR